MTRIIPATDMENAISLYLTGVSAENAAPIFGFSGGPLERELRRRGLMRSKEERYFISTRNRITKYWAEDSMPVDWIVDQFESGESVNSIAAKLNTSRNVIDLRLRAAGIQPRNRSEGMYARMARTTFEERQELAASANKAAKGREHSWDERCRRAATNQLRMNHISDYERDIAGWLADRGVFGTHQCAIGPYNADIGIHPIAVEVFGGGFHSGGLHKARAPERFRYILDQGWIPLIIWVDSRKFPLAEPVADYIVSLMQQSSGDPSMRSKYWVIRGNGQEVTAGATDVDQITRIPSYGRG